MLDDMSDNTTAERLARDIIDAVADSMAIPDVNMEIVVDHIIAAIKERDKAVFGRHAEDLS